MQITIVGRCPGGGMEREMFTTQKTLNNGVKIPMVGLGVFRMSADDTVASVRSALQSGYRHIDTASIYGNEAETGRGLKESGIARSDVFLTTKLWNDDMRSGGVREALETSLSLLGTDYVDLYLIHWPVKDKFIESYLVLEELYKEGKARAIGVSNFNPHHLDELMERASVVPAVNQVELHPLLAQTGVISYCERQGIAMEAYAPFGGDHAPALALPEISAIAQRLGRTPAQVALRWNIQRGVIVIPKSVKPERIRENADLDFVLEDADMAAINALNRDQRFNADPETFDF